MDFCKTHTDTPQKQTAFLECLKIIACFLVIVNHTNSQIFLQNEPSLLWLQSVTYFFVCRIAVPLFLIISGYTMLSKQYDYKKCFMMVLRYGVCLVVVSVVYYCYYILSGRVSEPAFKSFCIWIISGPISNAIWYMYLYMGLIIMMPFLQKMASNLQKKIFMFFSFCQVFLSQVGQF